MEHQFGTIQVKAEVLEDQRASISALAELRQRYSYLKEKQKEHLYAVYLGNDNEVIGDKLISLGSSTQTSFDLKDVVRTAILTGASAVILVHNHTSSNSQPTEADLETTQQVKECLDQFDVELLDHLIISRDGSYSFKAEGDL